MARRTRAAAVALLATLSFGGGVAAQDASAEEPVGPELAVLCATVSGDPAAGAWGEFTLTDALGAGEAGFELISEAATCGESPGDTDADTPLPVEIVESHAAQSFGSFTYVTIVRNPNDPGVALDMPARVDALDENGERVGFAYTSLSLLPGQTGVLSGRLVGVTSAVRTELVLPEYDSEFAFEVLVDASVELSDVETDTADPGSPRTTGTLQGVPEDALGVSLTAVYRDEGGEIIGTGGGFILQPSNGAEIEFEVIGFVEGEVAETELYYELN